jgi:hypothetical protein
MNTRLFSVISTLTLFVSLGAWAQTSLKVQTHIEVLDDNRDSVFKGEANLANQGDVKKLISRMNASKAIYLMSEYNKDIINFQSDLEKKRHVEIQALVKDYKPKAIKVHLDLFFNGDEEGITYEAGDFNIMTGTKNFGQKTTVTVELEGGDSELTKYYHDNQRKMKQLVNAIGIGAALRILGIDEQAELEELASSKPLKGVAQAKDQPVEDSCGDLLVADYNPFKSSLLEEAIDDLNDKREDHLKESKSLNKKLTAALASGAGQIKVIK